MKWLSIRLKLIKLRRIKLGRTFKKKDCRTNFRI
jgi:hypothetical protein